MNKQKFYNYIKNMHGISEIKVNSTIARCKGVSCFKNVLLFHNCSTFGCDSSAVSTQFNFEAISCMQPVKGAVDPSCTGFWNMF